MMLVLPFQRDWWTCMPLPLSPKRGLGMKVATMLWRLATFFTTYLYFNSLSAITVILSNTMSISAWPPVATSWWWVSMGIPISCMIVVISERISIWLSVGGTGK